MSRIKLIVYYTLYRIDGFFNKTYCISFEEAKSNNKKG